MPISNAWTMLNDDCYRAALEEKIAVLKKISLDCEGKLKDS